jgi:hypothetical protein
MEAADADACAAAPKTDSRSMPITEPTFNLDIKN